MSSRARSLVLFCLLGLTLLAPAVPAHAQAQVDSVAPPVALPESETVPPPGFRTSARQAIAIGDRVPKMRALRRSHPNLDATAWVWGGWRWELDYMADGRVFAEVDVGARGGVLAVFTGPQAQSYLARGHQGNLFDSPWVVLPFALLFLVPFVDVRRARRLLHLDLLVLLSLGVSYFFFNRGDVLTSVPLVYPVLLYVLARMLWTGMRPRERSERLVPHLPVAALAVGLVLLVGGRVALNVANKSVIDVGYASVVGADRVWHKKPLYVNNEAHGDTYGPINYLAYVPFEQAMPWKGLWSDLPAAHAAAIVFDLLTIAGLIALGTMLRAGRQGRRLGLALAWGWAAFPFTLLGLMLNTNDGLVALLLVAALLGLASPPGRGAMLALATGAKFIPGALVPLFARGAGDERGWRPLAAFGAAFAAVLALPVLLYLPDGRPPGVLGHHAGLPALSVLGVLDVGPAPRSGLAAGRPEARGGRAGRARVLLPARPSLARAGGGARRRGPDRGPAPRHSLVLLLRGVVHAVRAGGAVRLLRDGRGRARALAPSRGGADGRARARGRVAAPR